MVLGKITVKIIDFFGSEVATQTFINPPKDAVEILDRLAKAGYEGTLLNAEGDSLSGRDPLDDTQDYRLKLPAMRMPGPASVDISDRAVQKIADAVVATQSAAAEGEVAMSASQVTSTAMEFIKSRLNFTVVHGNHLPPAPRDAPGVPQFSWDGFDHEDLAAPLAAIHLQQHWAAAGVHFITVQSAPWLGFEWRAERVQLRPSRTDLLAVWEGNGGAELIAEVMSLQAKIGELSAKLASLDAELQTTGAELQLAQLALPTRRTERRAVVASRLGRQEIEGRVKDLKKQITRTKAEQRRIQEARAERLQLLVLHTCGVYEPKHPKYLAADHRKYKHQAVATLLITCANQLLLRPEHPGAVAILGDYNRHTIFVPRNLPPGPTRADCTTIIHGLSSFDTDESRQRAAGFMRDLLASRCSQLRSINFFETVPGGQNEPSAGGGNGSSGDTGGIDRSGEVGPDTSQGHSGRGGRLAQHAECSASGSKLDDAVEGAASAEHTYMVVADALTRHLRQRDVYKSLGFAEPPSTIPVQEAQEWLEGMWIVAA